MVSILHLSNHAKEVFVTISIVQHPGRPLQRPSPGYFGQKRAFSLSSWATIASTFGFSPGVAMPVTFP